MVRSIQGAVLSEVFSSDASRIRDQHFEKEEEWWTVRYFFASTHEGMCIQCGMEDQFIILETTV